MEAQVQSLDLSGEYTGRYLLVTSPGESKNKLRSIKDVSGLDLASSEDFKDQEVSIGAMSEGDGIFLSEIGVAIVNAGDMDQLTRLAGISNIGAAAEEDSPILEPERVVHALDDYGNYLKGYKDAVEHLTNKYFGGNAPEPGSPESEELNALAVAATYGLLKTKVVVNFPQYMNYTGKNIKVCVLDTGMDLNHPDFAGRSITSASFVPGQAVQDLHSHGTHCIGTSCGPKVAGDPAKDRYGVAYEAKIFAGKVLNNAGSGADGWILGGINWAVANKCQVISMSLGAAVNSPLYSTAYENAAQAALNAGSLIIAAAGNDYSKPVSHPANCPSIMAVAAVDSNLVKANFSNITFYPPHGKVDIAGPGVSTFSTVPMPARYGTKSGTSMATPHVAGIAALWAQKSAAYRGMALWNKLTTSALSIPQPVTHVGAGLVQAPYSNRIIRPLLPIKPILPKIPILIPKPKLPIPVLKPVIKKATKSTKTTKTAKPK